MDKYFRVETIRATPNPQQVIWAAMHQDYAEDFVVDSCHEWPDENEAGDLIVKHLLKGDKGHYGPLEHPQISLNAGYFPHSLMQQLRTHRIGISFDVQSMRYTGKRILDLCNHKGMRLHEEIEKVFYLRPADTYTDRSGCKYKYTYELRQRHLEYIWNAVTLYSYNVKKRSLSEEHARGLLPFDYRQHFVLSCNVRSLMHLLDLRWKKDAQLECQWFCDLLFQRFEEWCPAVAAWYMESRAKKARLAP